MIRNFYKRPNISTILPSTQSFVTPFKVKTRMKVFIFTVLAVVVAVIIANKLTKAVPSLA